jgi:uncharacterized membrane protein YraQ (UPF0718 family)
VLLVAVGLGSRGLVAQFFDGSAVQFWSTLLVSIVIQALPFLVLGVLISGAIAALVPPWLAGQGPAQTGRAGRVRGRPGRSRSAGL